MAEHWNLTPEVAGSNPAGSSVNIHIMSKQIKLMELLKQPLTEVGDLNNIKPYDFSNIKSMDNQFETDLGHTVDVIVSELEVDGEDIIIQHSPAIQKESSKTTYYNIEFTVEDSDTQYQQTDLKYLMRILKTVVEILTEVIIATDNEIEDDSIQQNIYTIFPESKFGEMLTDKQKYSLYKVILSKNLPSGYRIDDKVSVNVVGLEYDGFAITKKLKK